MKSKHQNQSSNSQNNKNYLDLQLGELFKNYQISESEVALFWDNQNQDDFLFKIIKDKPLSYEQAYALGLTPANLNVE